MFKTKTITGLVVVLAVLFMQVGTVFAAPATQDGTISGEIVSVEQSTPDANGDPTYLVTVNDGTGEQTVRVSYDTAVTLGLFIIDPKTNEPALDPNTGDPMLDPDKVGTSVDIDPTAVLPDEEPDEEPFNPVAGFLADYFGVTNATINQYHEDGYGFGVIAQALWISRNLTVSETEDENADADAELAGCILDAKKGIVSYGDCVDFGDDPVPTNWGQFRKALLDKKNNLGVIVSGHADNSDDATTNQEHVNSNSNKDKNKNKGNGHGHGQGHGQGNGN